MKTWDNAEEHLYELAVPSAVTVAKRFQPFATYDDLHQEIIVYILTHPNLVTELNESYATQDPEMVKWAARKIMARMRRHAERYARKEKSASLGYRPEDEYFYDMHKIATLIPSVINFDHTATIIIERGVDDGQPKGQSAPSEGGNLMAMIIDVKRIYDKLTVEDQQLLEQYYVLEMSLQQVADAWKISKSTADRRIQRLLRRIIRELGGVSPY